MRTQFAFLIALLLTGLSTNAQPSDAYVKNTMSAGHMPGINAVVVKDGSWMYQKSWGKADIANDIDMKRESLFLIASISKTIITTAVMQLWEKGAVKLNDNINRYLPFSVQHPAHPNDSITIRMLLTHTSSINEDDNFMTSLWGLGDSPISLDSFLRNYLVPGGSYYNATTNFYSYRPGTKSNYSNVGATLAAYIVERVTGDAYDHYCDTAIFKKICMDNTTYKLAGISNTSLIARPYVWYNNALVDAGDYGFPDYPSGQLRTNITALARFMSMYMQYGQYEGTRVLDSATVAYMMQPQVPTQADQGLIFYQYKVGNDVLWGHTGGCPGIATAMFFSQATKTGVIVLANGRGTAANNMLTVLDTLYRYGTGLKPGSTDVFPQCGATTAVSPVSAGPVVKAAVFPNPASHIAWVSIDAAAADRANLIVSDMQGRLVLDRANSAIINGRLMLDVRDLAAGAYLVRVCIGIACQNLRLAVVR